MHKFRAVIVVFVLILLVLPVIAQSDCVQFRGIGHARLLDPTLLVRPDDVWGGHVAFMFGEQKLTGMFSGQDGYVVEHKVSNVAWDGTYMMDFGGGNTILWRVGTGAWPYSPGKLTFGAYRSTAKIEVGTGRFEGATGNLATDGPFIWWLDDIGIDGYWNPTFTGKICGMKPAI
jgi:hypothetical protein